MNKKLRGQPKWLKIISLLIGTTIVLTNWQVTALSSEVDDTFLAKDNTSSRRSLDLELPELPSLGDADQYLYVPGDSLLAAHLVIKLSERRVYLRQGNQVINSYPIAVGKQGWETPTGEFEVIQMIKDPSWKHPWNGSVIPAGPDNPLGDRWIGFWTDGKNFIGFHGTPAEHLVGRAVSHGCIRMKNNDVRTLFEQVAIGTPVIVEP